MDSGNLEGNQQDNAGKSLDNIIRDILIKGAITVTGLGFAYFSDAIVRSFYNTVFYNTNLNEAIPYSVFAGICLASMATLYEKYYGQSI